MNRFKRLMRPAVWLALPLVLLAIVALWRPDVLRSDKVEFPAPFLSEQAPRPADWARPLDERFRFYALSPTLYRSALPGATDVSKLRDRGIHTVINFYQQDDTSWLSDDRITQVHIPLRGDRVTDTQVISVLRAIRQGEQRGGVLMHCKHGQNRTGLITAMYRIVYDSWTREEAMAEMLEGGFGRPERMDDAVGYLNRVDVAAFKHAIASGECSTNPLAWCRLNSFFSREDVPRAVLPTGISLR